MSDSSAKRHKGQLQVVEGSASGEFYTITRMENKACGNLIYLGEAKTLSQESEPKWHIQKFEYDSIGSIVAIKTALNRLTTKATELTVDLTSEPGFVKVSIVGGLFDMASKGDAVRVETTSNSFNAKIDSIAQDKLSILIKAEDALSAVAETSTTITDEDLVLTLSAEENKDFSKRRWDKRSFYFYA